MWWSFDVITEELSNKGNTHIILRITFYFSLSTKMLSTYEFIINIFQAFKDRERLMKHIHVTFLLTCTFLTGHMTMKLGNRYMKNEDSSTISYEQFNKSPQDTYPTFSICFTDDQPPSDEHNGLIYRHLEFFPGNSIDTTHLLTSNQYARILKVYVEY